MNHPPSVDKLSKSLAHHKMPAPLLVEVAREAIASGDAANADNFARKRKRRLLTDVINATGVLLHTNLGRAPMAVTTDANYLNLELDLETGKRGSRQAAVGELLATLCGAEAAMIVNNCAGATLLALAGIASGKGVVVSRGELVEIGGGFRIPEVMAQSGANLIEVGTTNRSRLSDYAQIAETADNPETNDLAMLLKVHRSNYDIVGFTEEVSVTELATLNSSVPIVADIGSGLVDSTCPWLDGHPPAWLDSEPAAKQTLAAGADLVMFSGDKLFGGPQAGIIVGDASLIERCAKHPLARALRPGSLVLKAMQHIAHAYLDRRGQDIDFWRMATADVSDLERRAATIATQAKTLAGSSIVTDSGLEVTAIITEAVPGGGTLPSVKIPSRGVAIGSATENKNSGQIAKAITGLLRDSDVPVIGRIENDTVLLDVRTVDPANDGLLAATIVEAVTGYAASPAAGKQ